MIHHTKKKKKKIIIIVHCPLQKKKWFIARFFSDSSKYIFVVLLSCKNKDGSIYCVNYM
jgi:hypothetical protein